MTLDVYRGRKATMQQQQQQQNINPLGHFWYNSVIESTALSNLRNYSMFISGFHHQIMSGHWWGLNSRNFEVRPMLLILNVISALEGTL